MLLYALLGDNLGLSVIVVAILIRLLLMPMSKKQYMMTAKMAEIRPKLDELQKTHKDDKEKLAKAQMELYKETGYNPLGCLASFVPQFLVLGAIFAVIRAITGNGLDGLYPFVKNFVFHDGGIEAIKTHFLGMDLAIAPKNVLQTSNIFSRTNLTYSVLVVAVGFSQYISTIFMQKMNHIKQSQYKPKKDKKKSTNKDDEPMSQEEMQMQMAKSMTAIFPLMIMYFTLSSPSVLGIYWFTQSWVFILQYFYIDRSTAMEAGREMFHGLKRLTAIIKIK